MKVNHLYKKLPKLPYNLYSSNELFKKHIADALDIVKNRNEEKRIIFLRSWNEWAEGNYMEPDLKFGHGYLDALKEMIIE